MTNEEAIKQIELAISEVEWAYPIDYAGTLNKAIFALKKIDELKLLMSIMTKDLKDVSMLCALAPVKMCLENDSIVWDEEMSKQYE